MTIYCDFVLSPKNDLSSVISELPSRDDNMKLSSLVGSVATAFGKTMLPTTCPEHSGLTKINSLVRLKRENFIAVGDLVVVAKCRGLNCQLT